MSEPISGPRETITDRQTAAQRQAQGIADILRERNEYRDELIRAAEVAERYHVALAALVAAVDDFLAHMTPSDTHTGCPERLQVDGALAAARRLVEP